MNETWTKGSLSGLWFIVALTCLVPTASVVARGGAEGLPPQAGVSEEQAVCAALNEIRVTSAGCRLEHPVHQATFSADGIRFSPVRGGPDWCWRLRDICVGEASLVIEEVAPMADAAARDVRYARGLVVERYVPRQAGIEQQFVIQAPLGEGADDVVIVGEIACDGSFESTPRGWQWRNQQGAVSLGHVRVFDADERELAATMTVWAAGSVIRVDGHDLGAARYPITIDPEIGTNDFRISHMGPDGNTNYEANAPAAAYNSTNNQYFVVWLADDNTAPLVDGELEIFGQRVDATTGAMVGARIRISDMGPNGNIAYSASRCDVAYNSVNNEYLVVWRGDDNTAPLINDELEIFGQRIDAATGAEIGTNDFRISDMNGSGSTFGVADVPAVAYNSTNNEYLVVWRGHENSPPFVVDEFEIWGQRLNAATGAEVGTNDFRISDAGPDGNVMFMALEPDVAYNSVNNEYLVVWQADDVVDNETEIYGQRITAANGAEVGTNDFRISDMGPDGNISYRGDEPAVAYNPISNEYLVVWHGYDDNPPLIAGELEIWGQRLNAATGAEVGTNDFRISDMGPDGNVNFAGINPTVAFGTATNEYLVTWAGDDAVNNDTDVYAQRLNAAAAEVGPNDFRLSDMGPNGNTNYNAGEPQVVYGASTRGFFISWRGDDNTAPLVDGEGEIFGQLFSTATTTTITSHTPDPSAAGQVVTINYTVSGGGGTPTGNVTVSDGAQNCTGTVAAGVCTITLANAGARNLVATYDGDADFSPSTSAAVTHTVLKANTTTTITSVTPEPSTFGQAVTITYSVAGTFGGTPTGNVTISDGIDSGIGTVAAGQCTITFSSSGNKTLTATYSGDAGFNGSTSVAVTHTVLKVNTATTITSVTPDPSTFGQAVVITYTVAALSGGAPTGNVTVSDGTDSCTAPVAAGQCTITFSSSGNKTLTAAYSGDAGFNGSTSAPVAHTVQADPSNPHDPANPPAAAAGPCGCGPGMTLLMPFTLLGLRVLQSRRPSRRRTASSSDQ